MGASNELRAAVDYILGEQRDLEVSHLIDRYVVDHRAALVTPQHLLTVIERKNAAV